jgi:carbon monoxide dehydrogenase subunit G
VRIRVGITIDAAPATVWQTVEPIERHVEWMADAESIRFTSPRTRGTGTSFDCVTKVGPIRMTDRMTVTEWDPGRAMGIEHHGLVTGRGRFTLRRRPRGHTRFTWDERLTFPLWMGGPIGALAAKPVLRAIWRRNLRRLKAIVEAV